MTIDRQDVSGVSVKSAAEAEIARGMLIGLGSYVIWGLVPIYWKLIKAVPAPEIMVFRIACTVVFCAGLLAFMGRLSKAMAILRLPRVRGWLVVSAALIGVNWWIFVWAVNEGRILETSLGYFINPLMSIFLGVVILGERLNRLQTVAVAIAAAGVAYQTWASGIVPLVPLALAVTFAFYGLVRKRVPVQSIDGLLVETMMILPVALGYGVWLAAHGALSFAQTDWVTQVLLLLAGPITAIPLMMFAAAVRRVRLSTMGFLQYVAPTLTMLTAVFIYHEPFGHDRAITFGLIWAALALVTYDLLRRDYSAAA